jgi:dTDP-4-amino-4,6-dideoxygalactose transaminase
LVSDRIDLIEAARKLHTYGIAPALSREGAATLPVPSFDQAGFNYRLSDVQAGIMRAQLRRLPALIAARTAAAARYSAGLGDLDQVKLPTALSDRTHPWQSYVLTLDPGLDRGAVAIALREHGVGCNFGTYASHVQPVYGETRPCPVSADLFDRHVAIPMHANLTEDDTAYVIDVIRRVVGSASVRA